MKPTIRRLRLALSATVLGLVLGATAAGDEIESLRLAIDDLGANFGDRYPRAGEFRQRLARLAAAEQRSEGWEGEFSRLRREALVANPLLDFDRLLVVRRADRKGGRGGGKDLGLPQNWQGNCALRPTGWRNDIAVLSCREPDSPMQSLFEPSGDLFVGDLDLSFDGRRILFSMPKSGGKGGGWRLWEVGICGRDLRQLTPDEPDVDHYDGCYLPDGRIIFGSTAGFQGVPCVGGGNNVANLYQLDPKGGKIRQLSYDQDHNWNPVVMNDGRVMYARWEYTDIAHYFSRMLFSMNPDGTNQMALYGSNSYWPNSIFYPRPIPGEATRVVAVVSGHHGEARMGELLLFDLAKGRHDAGGAVQRIPGRGKPVEVVVKDRLVGGVFPRFLHPYPLNGKYFLVSCQPDQKSPWGIWLVDVFDNMVPLREEEGYALLEPFPLCSREAPRTIPDRVDLSRSDSEVFLSDIYAGKAMEGVPRGTVKKLRVFEYHYAYRRMGGHIQVGIDGPWDVRRILGTVPVKEDGSAFFKVPANTPVAVQPLDGEGRAVQVMRSWFTGQPGERLSCTGCHEDASQVGAPVPTLAGAGPPVAIAPWRGPVRGFDFEREVQPVLDRHCVDCHDGSDRPGRAAPNLAGNRSAVSRGKGKYAGRFHPSYLELHPFVHRPGPESDSTLNNPGEYFAETSELLRLLRKGHHGVRLDKESFDRLVTWIDLNVPDHGTWGEQRKVAGDYHRKRLAARIRYANRPEDPEKVIAGEPLRGPVPSRERSRGPVRSPRIKGWPMAPGTARELQAGLGEALKIDLGSKVALELVPIPAGRFVMGDPDGAPDEGPRAATIDRPFFLSRCEISNRQYAAFKGDHDSGVVSTYNKDAGGPGLPMTRPDQPAARVSWEEGRDFCEWLSARTGRRFRLPTEAEWEWACRAGSAGPMNYGALDSDFGKHANLADRRLAALCRRDSPKWVPRVDAVDDRQTGPGPVGSYTPNSWGLHDMHGNLAEWTSSVFDPRGYLPAPERGAPWRVVRGGSFRSRPPLARSAYRCGYPSWIRVHDVGFRVVLETPE